VSTEVIAIRAGWRVESSTLVGAVNELIVTEGDAVIDEVAGEEARPSDMMDAAGEGD
jgi:hypothetical protein